MKRTTKLKFALLIAIFAAALVFSFVLNPNRISWLPRHVPAPEGRLSLFADFADVDSEKNEITLYIVNRTEKDIVFPNQDRDIYIKQTILKDGNWQRTEKHQFSWCGNSYMNPITVKSGRFLKYKARYPSKGKDAEVRYQLFNASFGDVSTTELISNVGKGKVDPDQVRAASTDTMAIRTGSFDFLSKIIRREIVIEKQDHIQPREAALYALNRHKNPGTLALLKDVLAEEKLAQNEFYGAYFSLIDLDKAEAVAWSMKVLNDKKHPLRLNVAQQAWRTRDPEIMKYFQSIVGDYKDPAFISVLACVASEKNPETLALLDRIQNDPLLPAEHRPLVDSIRKQLRK
jgi:hypothetical protein